MPIDHLKHGFIDFTKVEFWLLSSIRRLESSLFDFKKVVFSVGQEAENNFKEPFDNLIHRFFDFIQIAFWTGQEAEHEFVVPCNYWNFSFFKFNEVAFWAGPEAEKYLKVPSEL